MYNSSHLQIKNDLSAPNLGKTQKMENNIVLSHSRLSYISRVPGSWAITTSPARRPIAFRRRPGFLGRRLFCRGAAGCGKGGVFP